MKQNLPVMAPFFVMAFSPVAFAYVSENVNDVSILNDISVSANTGGNVGGVVTEGHSEVSVEVHQTVNGEELEPVVIKKEATSSPVSIEFEREATGEGYRVETQVEAQVGAESSDAESEEVAADQANADPIPQETFFTSLALSIHTLWSAVFQSLRSPLSWLF